jgi:hypothetical protein
MSDDHALTARESAVAAGASARESAVAAGASARESAVAAGASARESAVATAAVRKSAAGPESPMVRTYVKPRNFASMAFVAASDGVHFYCRICHPFDKLPAIPQGSLTGILRVDPETSSASQVLHRHLKSVKTPGGRRDGKVDGIHDWTVAELEVAVLSSVAMLAFVEEHRVKKLRAAISFPPPTVLEKLKNKHNQRYKQLLSLLGAVSNGGSLITATKDNRFAAYADRAAVVERRHELKSALSFVWQAANECITKGMIVARDAQEQLYGEDALYVSVTFDGGSNENDRMTAVTVHYWDVKLRMMVRNTIAFEQIIGTTDIDQLEFEVRSVLDKMPFFVKVASSTTDSCSLELGASRRISGIDALACVAHLLALVDSGASSKTVKDNDGRTFAQNDAAIGQVNSRVRRSVILKQRVINAGGSKPQLTVATRWWAKERMHSSFVDNFIIYQQMADEGLFDDMTMTDADADWVFSRAAQKYASEYSSLIKEVRAKSTLMEASSIPVSFHAGSTLNDIRSLLAPAKDDSKTLVGLKKAWRGEFDVRVLPLLYPTMDNVSLLLRAEFMNPSTEALANLDATEKLLVLEAVVADCVYCGADSEDVCRSLLKHYDANKRVANLDVDVLEWWTRPSTRKQLGALLPVVLMYASVQVTSAESERSFSATTGFDPNMSHSLLEICSLLRLWLQQQTVPEAMLVLLSALDRSDGKWSFVSESARQGGAAEAAASVSSAVPKSSSSASTSSSLPSSSAEKPAS